MMTRSADFQHRLATVKLLAMDVDGVLTDGGLYYTETGQELKRFHVKDGMGMKQVLAAGVAIAILSASHSEATLYRARKLGISLVFIGVEDKLTCLLEICQNLQISPAQVAYIGDDLNDIPVLEKVGVPLTVADGISAVKELSCYITVQPGGQGAVREICDLLLGELARHE